MITNLKNLFVFIGVVLVVITTTTLQGQIEVACIDEHPEFPDGRTLCEKVGNIEYDLIIPGNSTASQLNLPLFYGRKSAFNMNIYISGDFFVDEDLAFWGCNVEFSAGAEVFVHSGSVFSGINSNFYCCNYMWQGFNVGDASHIRLSGCNVEDAEIAVLADATCTVGLSYNVFNRNYIGIQNGAQINNNSELVFTAFAENSFTCNALLNPPRETEYSYAGILLDNCVSEIGRIARVNYFVQLNYGVKSEYSTVNVSGCSFKDLRTDAVLSGTGIDMEDGELTTQAIFNPVSSTYVGGNSFENCLNGIYGHGADLEVSYNTFSQPYILGGGVSSDGNYLSERINILSNMFENFGDRTGGITIERPSGASGGSGVTINQNILNVYGKATYGIGVFANIPSQNACGILFNDVYLHSDEKTTGIRIDVGTGEKHIISNNFVEFMSTSPNPCHPLDPDYRNGFIFVGGITTEHFAFDNDSYGIGTFSYLNLRSPNWHYCENESDGSHVGFDFIGLSDPVRLTQNKIYEHEIGLRIRDDGMIGRQERRNNEWLEDYNNSIYDDWAALSLHPFPLTSEFLVPKGSDATILPPLRSPGGSQWFVQEDGFYKTCNDFPLVSESEEALIADSTNQLNQSAANLWDLSYEFLLRMYRNPQIGVEHSGAQSYFNSMTGSTQKQLAAYTNEYFDILKTPQVKEDSLVLLKDSIQSVFQEIVILDTTLSEIDTFIIDTAFISQKRQKLQTIDELHDKVQSIEGSMESDRSVPLSNLLNDVESMSTSSTYEDNQKMVLATSIRRVLDITVYNEEEILEDIAHQCPEFGGKAVFWARSMLSRCNPYSNFNMSNDTCYNIENTVLSNQTDQDLFSWKVSPNPGSGIYEISFGNNVNGVLNVRDIAGTSIKSVHLTEKATVLVNISDLPSGIYFFDLVNEEGQIMYEKVIKQ